MAGLVSSEKMEDYFKKLEEEADRCYEVAEKARSLGYDPEEEVEIPRAEDLALRAEQLTNVENTAEKIRELSEKYEREEVSLRIAKEVASREEGSKAERIEDAIRIGLAVLTEGILVAPLEGIGGIDIRENNDGTEYLELSFAGPIRSAGGTGQAMSVLIADMVRREMDIGEFKPTPAEIQRFKEEIPLYKKSLGLQYTPSAEEISLIVDGCPVSISGEGTGREEVSGNRDLPRVDTNQVRGGACLVIAEGMCLKAKKLKKHVKKLDIEGWEFLEEYIDRFASGEKDEDEDSDEDEEERGVAPKTQYIEETIAGRPVFGHPSEKGGFRLRYGRTRTGGLASVAINPATMYLTDEFMALGTQIKTERPGKAGAITPCDSVEGPTVLLDDGEVKRVDSPEEAKELQSRVQEIIDLGEILIPFGEFIENNHKLVPGAYCHEWWIKEIDEEIDEDEITGKKAMELSKEKGYPLHPEYTYFWSYVDVEEIEDLREWISEKGAVEEDELVLPKEPDMKGTMEKLGIPHRKDDGLIVEGCEPLLFSLGLDMETLEMEVESDKSDPLDHVSELAGVRIGDKGPTTIGSRMARPEKAKERKMTPPVHGLFPLGEAGGSERLVKKAVEEGIIEVEISARRCQKCGKSSAQIRCSCGGRCEVMNEENQPQSQKIPMDNVYRQALGTLGEGGNVQKIKGVKGLITETKTPEALEKGILRAKHDIYVFKDGTSRYDMTDLPLTHFKPKEVGLSVPRARELGYEQDINGEELKDEDQILELKPQDLILANEAGSYMIKVADFVDDLLEKYYEMDSYYDVDNKEDMVGKLVVGLAPHTSGGVLGRIIGYQQGRACYAHPYFHAAKRRNCLPGNTEVKMANGSSVELRELYEKGGEEERLDSMGTFGKDLEEKVLTVPEDEIETSKASKVVRTPASEFKIEIETEAGRTLEVFPDHRVKTDEGVKKARELEEDDKFLTPLHLDIQTEDMDHFDLIELLSDIEDVMIREVGERMNEAVKELEGLKSASEELNVSEKDLDNYRRRESVPLDLYKKIMRKVSMDAEVAEGEVLAAKRDKVKIPSKIDVDSDLMKLLGYYLAEGYTRKSEEKGKEFYQVCFAFGEEELEKNIREAVRGVFGIDPSKQENVLTLSSRLIYEFFQKLEMGSKAKEKRVPEFVKSLPEEKVSDLLSAYFAGDGSVEKERLHVQATSASRGLLDDIDFLLKRFGIYARYSQSEREAGGVLVEKYGEEHYNGRTFVSNKLHIRSSHAVPFGKEIGFDLERKQDVLEAAYSLERKPRVETDGGLVKEKIESKRIKKSDERFMYDIEVEDTHNFVTRDNIITNNCDGDEDCIMLLLDGLLNFSEHFLPEKRGGLMDAPLVMTSKIDPAEIDSEAHNVDIVWNYPLEFYERTFDYPGPKEVEDLIEIVEDRLGEENQYEDFGYTHETTDIAEGPSMSRYTRLGKMTEKMDSQIKVAEMIRAVDTTDVVSRVISDHFIPDLIGNLNKFGVQEIRCTKCNTKYRRMPLNGECTCGGNLTLTIHEGSVNKYLKFSLDMVEKYDVPEYLYQRVKQLEKQIESLFENDKVSTPSLDEFC